MLRTLPFTFLLFASCGFSIAANAQTSLGSVVANTNPALPDSYNFQEYVFAEPNDQGVCTGATNTSASISDIFFAQTHRNSIDNPFYFLIGYRPALLQIAVTGNGVAPDVMVEGFLNGSSLGSLCLKGPAELSVNVNLDVPDFDNYFSVTLPKAWVQPGLTLSLKAGEQQQELSEAQLKVGPYTELNLVMFELDVLDYNLEEHIAPIINNFLQETASSIPASVIRYGTFPARLRFPEIIANNDTEQLVRLKSRSEMPANNILSDGYINSIAALFMASVQRSTADSLSTLYFGNTLNLAPGGWGGGHSFVSFDFDDVYIHELGHALSLPHWGVAADPNSTNTDQYLYPYDGIGGLGGGRGEAWNFIQDIYEFVDPICQYDERGVAGQETSDAMQRNNHCFGKRSNSKGPWDGFGNFSALAIHRYLTGAQETAGNVTYKGQQKGYRLNTQQGFPTASLVENERVYTRHPAQPQEKSYQENFRPVGKELANQDVYLLYGTTHETQDQANILYAPVKFNGTLPPVLDPTDPTTFEEFKTNSVYPSLLGSTRDLTFKMTYADGSILHAVNPYQSFTRVADYPADYFNIWRYDLSNFALVVPGDKELLKVELFHRPFVVRGDSTLGNVLDSAQNITAENFMNAAVLKAEYDLTVPPILPLAKNSIGNRVWHDLNRNSIDDLGEPGIAGVKLLLWRDSDGDGIPDSSGFAGAKTTDANGNFRFIDLAPGNYMVFVWHLENWLSTGPLFKMEPSAQFAEPNNDINNDNNGRTASAAGISFPGLGSYEVEPGVIGYDIPSGSIELTAEGEPLNDGDFVDGRFDFDRSGNMTVDFGFHLKELTAYYNAEVLAIPSLAVNGVNYKVELTLQSSTTIDFQVTAASITTDLASNDLASFSNNELSIPNLLVGSDTYSVVLTLSNSSRSIFSLKSAVKN